MDSAQGCELAAYFGDLRQIEKLSEIKPSLPPQHSTLRTDLNKKFVSEKRLPQHEKVPQLGPKPPHTIVIL